MWVETFVEVEEEEEGESVNAVSVHHPLTAYFSVMLTWCYQHMFQSMLKEVDKAKGECSCNHNIFNNFLENHFAVSYEVPDLFSSH